MACRDPRGITSGFQIAGGADAKAGDNRRRRIVASSHGLSPPGGGGIAAASGSSSRTKGSDAGRGRSDSRMASTKAPAGARAQCGPVTPGCLVPSVKDTS
jgi:hypothetical protein